MFQQLLFIQWKGSRFGLVPFIFAAFALPLVVIQGIQSEAASFQESTFYAQSFLSSIRVWSPLFPLLASVTGVTMALTAWTWDHRGDHVYALSLPVSRWRYVLMKMAAGGMLLLIPCFALWLGALMAGTAAEIPEGLRAYPGALALRFVLTAFVVYGMLFALAAGTMRTALWVLGACLFVVFFGGTVTTFLGNTILPGLDGWNFMDWLGDRVLYWPGPFDVITGNWMLFDV